MPRPARIGAFGTTRTLGAPGAAAAIAGACTRGGDPVPGNRGELQLETNADVHRPGGPGGGPGGKASPWATGAIGAPGVEPVGQRATVPHDSAPPNINTDVSAGASPPVVPGLDGKVDTATPRGRASGGPRR